jgi:aldehyde dehydrogenase (NAD+)
MAKTYKMYIGGKWVNSSSGRTFERRNPATGALIGRFQKGNKEDVKKAVDAAEHALKKWSKTPPPTRGQILFKISRLLRENKERLARSMTEEMGKVLNETRGDVQEAIDMFEYMGGEGRRLFGRTTTSELKDKLCFTIRDPIGVVGMIAPWNFPMAIPAWKMAPALICGNTMVFKPASDTPRSAIQMIQIFEKAGVPPGVVNLVTGGGEEVGIELVRNKKVRMISFTGHKDTGKTILKEASQSLKKVSLELGSKNVTIIMDDADLNLALEGVVWGAFGTTGQRCTASSRVIADDSIKKKFERLLVARAKKLKLGYGLNRGVDVGPLVNERALEKVDSYTKLGVKEGARLLTGGKRFGKKGWFYEPTVFTDASAHMRISKEEIFGPTTAVISSDDLDEAIKFANSVDYGLSFSIYTRNVNSAMKAVGNLESGIVYVNAPTIGAEVHLPFGGVKGTGWTREAGWSGIDEFSHEKTVYIDYSGKLQKAQIDID